MRILGLDLGTKTGWACNYGYEVKQSALSGVQDFSLKRGESPGMRYLRFRSWLAEIWGLERPTLIVYEQAHHRGGAATQVLNGLVSHLQAFCAEKNIDHTPVHSATLKKFATGSGRASKADMVKAMQKRWNWDGTSDDEADALAVLAWAIEEYGGKDK